MGVLPHCRVIAWAPWVLHPWLLLPLLLTCGFPSDESGTLFVTLEVPSNVVVRGDSLILVARTWQDDASGQQQQVRGLTYTWISLDSSVAVVSARPDGSASVRGLDVGVTEIRAIPRDYESAQPGMLALRVANTVEIDSVVPDTVRYGEQITLYGAGLGRITRVIMGEVSLVPDSSSFVGDSTGVGQQRFWIPYPARSNRVLAVAEEGFSAPAKDSTFVIREDLYQDSTETPATIRLEDGPGILFSNPALAFTSFGDIQRDFHFLRSDTSRALTFIVTTYDQIGSPYPATWSSQQSGHLVPSITSWISGNDSYCRTGGVTTFGGNLLFPPFIRVQAFKDLPAGDVYLSVFGDQPGRFGVQVIDGYQTADPRISADRFEENDHCVAADVNFSDPGRRIDSFPFADTLTIDNPFDADWIRFQLPPSDANSPTQLITVRTQARPFGASDSSDLYLSVGRVPAPSQEGITWDAYVDVQGSSERLSVELAPGDYYLLVSDGAGVATRYALCIGLGVTCSLDPGQ